MFIQQNGAAMKVSYEVSLIIAQQKKAQIIGVKLVFPSA